MTSPGSSTAYQQALDFLLGRIDYERTPPVRYGKAELKLDRMRRLLARLGDPQDRYPLVHLAGTKGKGSTATMIAGILTAAGIRTGLYTSPHLQRIEERMAVDGRPSTSDEFVELVALVRPEVERLDDEIARAPRPAMRPTYFEVTTAMALLHFARRRVEAAVIEVGMGGRLDSTNVCRPAVSVITSISFDHTRQLGNTLGAIAREKAGIVKPGVPVVSGVTQPEPQRVVREACRRQGSPLYELGRDFDFVYRPAELAPLDWRPAAIDFSWISPPRPPVGLPAAADGTSAAGLDEVPLGMLGRHQGANAAVAIATINQWSARQRPIPAAAVRQGLAAARCPARIEVLSRQPVVIIDAAHNVASIEALLEALTETRVAGRRWLVFATTQDKDIDGMLRLLLPGFEQVVLTRYLNNPRAVEAAELAARVAALGGAAPVCLPDPAAAWDFVRSRLGPDDLACMTGSFFLAAEMRAAIHRQPLPRWSTETA